ncbi:hypothetical protein [Diaphorobacter aerolatus]|uniref:Uncharacterized protein n=1 Tax=Diaphorobacter aerolatus TaxID=1288495 RepID=A0A7H0GLZ4_9BURK|nr:hypothetical protein [Diaphorobacter aerolatus]QNP49310.1 hypothetical protein H9K75_04395 [Diaphorobacter aerolatus]
MDEISGDPFDLFQLFVEAGCMTTVWISGSNDDFLQSRKDALRYGVLKLIAWPDLARVPEERQALVARICALLSRKPSASKLIPLILSTPEDEVFESIAPLMRMGCVTVATSFLSEPGTVAAQHAPAVEAISSQAQTANATQYARRSLVSKLWARLTA